jgi:hypothetical protein
MLLRRDNVLDIEVRIVRVGDEQNGLVANRRPYTGSHSEHGEPRSTRPGLFGRSGVVAVARANGTLRPIAKFFFKNPSFNCTVT